MAKNDIPDGGSPERESDRRSILQHIASVFRTERFDRIRAAFKRGVSSDFGVDDPKPGFRLPILPPPRPTPILRSSLNAPMEQAVNEAFNTYAELDAIDDDEYDIDWSVLDTLGSPNQTPNRSTNTGSGSRLMPAGLEHDLGNPELCSLDVSMRATEEFLRTRYGINVEGYRSAVPGNLDMSSAMEAHIESFPKRSADVIFQVKLADGTPLAVKCNENAPRTFSVYSHDAPIFSSRSIYAAMNVMETLIQSSYAAK